MDYDNYLIAEEEVEERLRSKNEKDITNLTEMYHLLVREGNVDSTEELPLSDDELEKVRQLLTVTVRGPHKTFKDLPKEAQIKILNNFIDIMDKISGSEKENSSG